MKRATIPDLAREAGVSVATVDRVLNGRLKEREETARMVHEAARRIGFHGANAIHSRILADFMRDVYAGHLRRLEQHLSPSKDWETFLDECVQRDPAVANFSDTTKAKMLQVVLRVLAEAKYLDSTKTVRLTPPHLHPDVVRFLKQNDELVVLSTMDMTQ